MGAMITGDMKERAGAWSSCGALVAVPSRDNSSLDTDSTCESRKSSFLHHYKAELTKSADGLWW